MTRMRETKRSQKNYSNEEERRYHVKDVGDDINMGLEKDMG